MKFVEFDSKAEQISRLRRLRSIRTEFNLPTDDLDTRIGELEIDLSIEATSCRRLELQRLRQARNALATPTERREMLDSRIEELEKEIQ